MNAKISASFQNQVKERKSSGSRPNAISLGCPITKTDYCVSSPCENLGRCESGHNSFKCDCFASLFDGPTCGAEPLIVSLGSSRESDYPVLAVPRPIRSEAENIEVKFKTKDDYGVLLDTASGNKKGGRVTIALRKGKLELMLKSGGGSHVFSWGYGLNDNEWHTVRVKRTGEKLLLFIDGRWEHSYFLPSSDTVIYVDEISGGHSLNHEPESFMDESSGSELFEGFLAKLVFNNFDVLHPVRDKMSEFSGEVKDDSRRLKNRKAKSNTVSFDATPGMATFATTSLMSDDVFRISFKFRTLLRSAMILMACENSTMTGNYMSIELWNGRIRYSYGINGKVESVLSPSPPTGRRFLSDMRWHSVLIHQDAKTGLHHLFVDNSSNVLAPQKSYVARLSGNLYLGSRPEWIPLPPRKQPSAPFRGCVSALKVANDVLDVFSDSPKFENVQKGCPNPSARCHSNSCQHNGKCHQGWKDIKCDCSMTTYGGDFCDEMGTTYAFDSNTFSTIFLEYPKRKRPSSNADRLVVGFQTKSREGVLLSVQCAVDGDFLTVYLADGYIQVRYNLGSKDHHLGFFDLRVNDNRYHVVVVDRRQFNVSLTLDDQLPVRYIPQDQHELYTLNMQWRISIGASFNVYHSASLHRRKKRRRHLRIFDGFSGNITGVNFNGLKIFDLYAKGDERVSSIGSPTLLHMATPDASDGPFRRENMQMSDAYANVDDDADLDGLIEGLNSGCLSFEEQQDCIVDTQPEGFFTPILPTPTPTVPSTVSSRRRTSSPSPSPKSALSAPPLPPTPSTLPARAPTVTATVASSDQRNLFKPVHFAPVLQRSTTTFTTFTTTPAPTVLVTVVTMSLDVDYDAQVEVFYEEDNDNDDDEEAVAVALTKAAVRKQQITITPDPFRRAIETEPDYLEDLWSDLEPPPLNTAPPTTPSTTQETSLSTTSSTSSTVTTTTSTTTLRPTVTPPSRASTRRTTVFRKFTPPSTTTSTAGTAHSTVSVAYTKPKPRTTLPSHTVYAVRPTTPMGDLFVTTQKGPVTSTDFPRTALISIASVSVIVIIAIVVFCVFRCRQNGPGSDHYPMVCNGTKPATTPGGGHAGYAPIPSEMSPQLMHHDAAMHQQHHLSPSGICSSGLGHTAARLIANGNGYQPINGAVIPNGAMMPMNGTTPKNGNLAAAQKKDFKEWYV
ncbi:hypothetical protein L596_027744 [Steinernema carpocapsae]|uniref:EGF-like domain-containing protein n=1 Tax=Steinernema carpocapsae TaxID=34508 RepID=A0A4U5LWE5_STECR|nr:hypothetical protein L596_027744 [Steinernema carpocapsae]